MFFSIVALLSTLAIASSADVGRVSKKLEETLSKIVEQKTNLRPESGKNVEVVNFKDGFIQSTYTSVFTPAQVVAQQTFIGGIFGPVAVTGLTGSVFFRLQFDTVTSSQYQLTFYNANPLTASTLQVGPTIIGPISDLVSFESNYATNPYLANIYTYAPNSNSTAQPVFGGVSNVVTKYSASTPLYLTSLPQIVQSATLFGATIFTAQIFTGVFNSGKVSYQYSTTVPNTNYPTFAPVPSAAPVAAVPSPKPVPVPSIGYTLGAEYDLIQYQGLNGQGLAIFVSSAPSIQLGGTWTYTTPRTTTPAITTVQTYLAFLNAPSSSSSSSTTCFSGSSEVAMESGVTKQISEVAVGDRVLAYSTKTQSAVFSSVVAVPHNKNNKVSEFVQITTESGKVVKMTSEHLIQSCEGLVAASKIASGACVVTVDGQENVSAVEKVVEEGLYTIVTEEELVVVDGVVASPFAVNHFIPNMFYNFHRFAFGLMPSFLSTKMMESVSTVADEVAQYYTVATDSL